MKMKKWLTAAVAAAVTAASLAGPTAVMAQSATGSSSSASASTTGKTCVSLGADLTSQQRATVLSLLGITEEDLSKDTVITVTNAEEHEAFDSYIDKSITGTRALVRF